ncbi:MAG: DUF5320 domain-containing protein [Candidatus Thermoplasmatota archaeon]|nr:DUF5320 domain-containing protein [Candidatus Thermoplasmatota archaeon]
MPGGDRTGPWGQGPMTGRRMGYCSGSNYPGYTGNFGWGGGRGYGRRTFGPGRFGRFFGFGPFRRGFFFGRGRW